MTADVAAPRQDTLYLFGALLRRDARVVRRELPFFLLRTTLQPLLVVFVFGFLLPRMGFMRGGYTGALLPGVLAISITLSSVMAVAFPMIVEFGVTGEIEDRLLAPIAMRWVATAKVVGATVQGMLAAFFLLPIARLIMGPIEGLTVSHVGIVLLLTVLGAAAFSTFGLWLGTTVSPQQIGTMFGVFLTPLIFFGCTYYPWKGLSVVPVMQYLVLLNPLVYVSEGMRAAITPDLPHMPLGVVIAALLVIIGTFWTLGMRSFRKRAVG